ncbi:MAG: RNA polymerase sigma factor [Bacteroidales bacterium]|nr:RNA polymerase sigma factor [Bacteroidales bacterium]MCM1147936.1 RNA polymerase sigma factor [Bacteroidales bacterium]MCM1205485.1 RNA polymerase sigma factor [Bacillota bacterium]MCM1509253.1 RNA polymerase sigma factor [Clostridium sp.]
MNQKEFEAIASSLRHQALAKARILLSNDASAEDVAQDTMLKLWAIHDDIRNKEHAQRLVSTISQHLAIDTIRHARRTSALMVPINNQTDSDKTPLQPPDSKAISAHRRMEIEEDMQWLSERIATLPNREMQVMKMRQTEMKSNDEIAAIMGITTASVATMLSSARRKIFEDLKKRNKQ